MASGTTTEKPPRRPSLGSGPCCLSALPALYILVSYAHNSGITRRVCQPPWIITPSPSKPVLKLCYRCCRMLGDPRYLISSAHFQKLQKLSRPVTHPWLEHVWHDMTLCPRILLNGSWISSQTLPGNSPQWELSFKPKFVQIEAKLGKLAKYWYLFHLSCDFRPNGSSEKSENIWERTSQSNLLIAKVLEFLKKVSFSWCFWLSPTVRT